uniref:nicotinamidase n=1 Tax=uncultured Muribaculaceae bacterium TaxID=2301481 RepID=A0A6G8F3K8_9BACT|nr:nicotinamidase [uncultured Muribaculaceae bacterium]
MKNKLLLIIDPQVDFITGALPVAGAENAMNALAEYIRSHNRDYSHIIVTADRHPMRHCSFSTEGGEWPVHCVSDSVGAAIWPDIMDVLLIAPDKVKVLHKGEDPLREEYSIFKNYASKESILRILAENGIEEIDICGLAGDVCVSDTILDGLALELPQKINVLTEFSPSIDGGNTLDAIISNNALSSDRK